MHFIVIKEINNNYIPENALLCHFKTIYCQKITSGVILN